MRRKQANVQHYERQAYKKDRMVAKALLGAFSHVRVSLNIKQIEIFKMADIGKRIQRENYQPWISSEHKENIEFSKGKKKGWKNYLPSVNIDNKDNIEFLKGKKGGKLSPLVFHRLQRKSPRSSEWTKMAGNYIPWNSIDYNEKGREIPNEKMAGNYSLGFP